MTRIHCSQCITWNAAAGRTNGDCTLNPRWEPTDAGHYCGQAEPKPSVKAAPPKASPKAAKTAKNGGATTKARRARRTKGGTQR